MAKTIDVEKVIYNIPYINDSGVKETTSIGSRFVYILTVIFGIWDWHWAIDYNFGTDINARTIVNDDTYSYSLLVKYRDGDANGVVRQSYATNFKDFINNSGKLILMNGKEFGVPAYSGYVGGVQHYTNDSIHLRCSQWHAEHATKENFGMTFVYQQTLYETEYDKYTYYIENENKIIAYKYQSTSLGNAQLLYDKQIKKTKTRPNYTYESRAQLKENLSGTRIFTGSGTESFQYTFRDINNTSRTIDSDSITVIPINRIETDTGTLKVNTTPIVVNDYLNKINLRVIYERAGVETIFNGFPSAANMSIRYTLLVNGLAYRDPTLIVLPEHIGNISVRVQVYDSTGANIHDDTVPVNVVAEADFPVKFELNGARTDFNYGEEFNFGDTATLKAYNALGELITTCTGHTQIMDYCNRYLVMPYYLNEKLDSITPVRLTSNGEQIIQMKMGDTEVFRFGIFVTYPEAKMMVVTRQNRTWQVDEGDGLNLKAIGEVQKIELVYRKNTKAGGLETVYVDITNRNGLVWSKENVTLSEAYSSDIVRVRFSYSAGTLEEEQEGSAAAGLQMNIDYSIEINLIANIPVDIRIEEDETQPYKTYYRYKGKFVDFGNNDKFEVPSNLTYFLVYKDGTSKPINDVYFKNTKYDLERISAGTKLKDGIWSVAVCYDYQELSISVSGIYDLHTEDDYLLDLRIQGKENFILGNKYSQDKFVVIAIIGNGATVHKEVETMDYAFKDTGRILEAQETISLLADEGIYNLDTSGITYSYPTYKKATVIRNGTRLSYINKTTNVDLSTSKIMVEFTDTDYVEETPFDSTHIKDLEAIRKSTGATISIESFTGEHPFSEEMASGELLWEDCSFNITFRSNLMTADVELQDVLPFSLIKENQDVTSLSVLKVTTEYYVGDEFLNDSDTTIVHITTAEGQFNVPLRSDCPLINVNPERGHVFSATSAATPVTVTYAKNANIQTQYSIRVNAKGYVSSSETLTLAVVLIKQFPNEARYKNVPASTIGYLALIDINDTVVLNNERVVNVDDPYYYGYVDNFFNNNYNARVVLFDDFIPESDAESNITVKFPSYQSGIADNINKCHFGILFGANNAENRLFLSGNKNIPNADFHSAELNMNNTDGEISAINGDFSYFAWESVMYYGETDNAVVGYDIVSNDKLLVLKTKSDKEKTVYFRTPTTVPALDASGTVMKDVNGDTIGQEEFALIKGNNSNAGISPKSICNFNGDTVFVDQEKQIVGLDLTGIIGDSQRYANSRSLYIDRKLKECDLSDAFMYTNQNYLFLAIKNVGIFVTHYLTKSSETGQYEWWFLSSKNPSCFIEIDDKIYFGNDDGEFYLFNNGEYRDMTKIFADGSACIYDYDEERCYIDHSIIEKLDSEKTYHFKSLSNPIYYRVARISNFQGGDFEPTDLWVNNAENRLELLTDILLPTEVEYYLNHIDGSKYIDCDGDTFSTYGDTYKLKVLDDPKHFGLQKKVNGVYVDVEVHELNNAVLCRKVIDAEMTDIQEDSFRLKDDFGVISNIVQYGLELSRSFNGEIILYENVEAYYITAPFTMGNLSHFKTLWSFTLSNDTKIPSELEVAYASNKIPYVMTKTIAEISKEEIGVDMSSLNFKKVDLDKNLIPRTYTTHRPLAKQRYTCFCFRNTNDTNCVLSAMSVIYSIPYENYSGD